MAVCSYFPAVDCLLDFWTDSGLEVNGMDFLWLLHGPITINGN